MIRNPKQEFVAKLEETRTKSQMADSFSSMVLPSSTLNNPFMSTWERGLGLKCRMNPMGGMAPMAPMAPMGGMNPMASMGGMSPMAPMGGMNPMASMAPMNPMASMSPMAPMNPMAPMAPMASMAPMAPMAPVNPINPAQTPSTTQSKVPKMVYTRTDISMEEWRASQPKYRYHELLTLADARQ